MMLVGVCFGFFVVFLNNVLGPRQSYGNDIGGEPYYCTGIQIIK